MSVVYLLQVAEGEEKYGLQELLLLHSLYNKNGIFIEKLLEHLQWYVVEEVGVVISDIPTRLARENDRPLQQREGGQAPLGPRHPHSEVLVDVFRIFFLDPLVQLGQEIWHQIDILEWLP